MIPLLSIVVPCYNEEDNLSLLTQRIRVCAAECAQTLEIVLVDDGSRDGTAQVAARLAADHADTRFIGLSRNFGKESAMLAGLQAAQGVAVIIMDGDLQHPPELIPRMVAGFESGFDQVMARRNRDGDHWLRTWFSRLYYAGTSRLMEVRLEDGVGDFRLLSRRAVDAVLALTETNRFSKGLFAWVGFPGITIDYANVGRASGRSSWSVGALVNYGIDGVVSFNTKPLRTAIHLGALAFSVFVLYFAWLVISWLFHGIDIPGYITTVAVMVGIGGIQLLFLGVIGEYVGRIYNEVKRRPPYLVAVDTGADGARDADARD